MPNTPVPSNIPTSAVALARSQWSSGQYKEAWNTLAQAGDRYADNAAGVLGRNQDVGDRFFQNLVKSHWENTVGADAYQQKFHELAGIHLENYLLQLENGYLPTTQDVISSYESAAAILHLDTSVAFDGALARATDPATALWGVLLGMDPSRITTSFTTNTLTRGEAFDKLFGHQIFGSAQDGAFFKALYETWRAGETDALIANLAGRGIENIFNYIGDLADPMNTAVVFTSPVLAIDTIALTLLTTIQRSLNLAFADNQTVTHTDATGRIDLVRTTAIDPATGLKTDTLRSYDPASQQLTGQTVTTTTVAGNQTIVHTDAAGRTDLFQTIGIDPTIGTKTADVLIYDANGNVATRAITEIDRNNVLVRQQVIATDAATGLTTDTVSNYDPVTQLLTGETVTSTTTAGDQAIVHTDAAGRTDLVQTISTDPDSGTRTTEVLTYDAGTVTNHVVTEIDRNNILVRQETSTLDPVTGVRTERTSVYSPFDGSLVNESFTTTKQDGSRSVTTDDGNGLVSTTSYNAAGELTSNNWRSADGSRGSETFKFNGSVSGLYVRSDGTFQSYADDGKGNIVVVEYDRNGRQTGNDWWKADGSHGSVTIGPDGSKSGIVYAPDGSYQNYTIDKFGNESGSVYDAQGKFVASQWRNADGSSGSSGFTNNGDYFVQTLNGNGGESVTTYSLNGVVRVALKGMAGTGILDDGQGQRIETQWGPDGVGIVSSRIIEYNPDGSGKITTTDADGRTTETTFGPGSLGPLAQPEIPNDAPSLPTEPPSYIPVSIWEPSEPSGEPLMGPPTGLPSELAPGIPSVDPSSTGEIDHAANDDYLAARSFIRKDPLTLDLDGDGIETRAATGDAVTLFDYDRDGIRTGTGWIAPDDGLVVMDRDSNGSIDSGAELFGVDTVLADGTKATDGFAALRDLDVNHDNLFNAADAAFSQVRIWQDANSDGVSQAAELKTLAQQGISAIRLTATPSGQILSTQNQIAYTGTYDKTNGTTGTAYAINFADNPFYRQYPDGSTATADNPFTQENAPIPLTPEAQSLPAMQGAGAVRDLREAASLDVGLAQRMQGLIDAGIQSRPQLWAQMDGLAEQWAATSAMKTSIEQAQGQGFVLHYLPPGVMGAKDLFYLYGIVSIGGGDTGSDGSSTVGDIDLVAEKARIDALKVQSERLERIIGILERYNGMTFVDVSELGVTRGNGQLEAPKVMSSSGSSGGGLATLSPYLLPSLDKYQVELLERSYTELQQSLYGGIVLQTRLKPYLDDVSLTIDESGIRLDTSAMEARLASRHSADQAAAYVDALELRKYMPSIHWNAEETLVAWALEAQTKGELDALRSGLVDAFAGSIAGAPQIVLGTTANDDLRGANADDLLVGGDGTDTLFGGDGMDILDGGAGTDTLHGGDGNDILTGGAGKDTLWGNGGNNVYRFGRGDGQDTIQGDFYATANVGVIEFKEGIAPSDIVVRRVQDYTYGEAGLELAIAGTTDKILVAGFFHQDQLGTNVNPVQQVRFADGTVWDMEAVKTLVFSGTSGDDYIIGLVGDDALSGGAGNDELKGRGGADFLDGGAGNDTLRGEAGDDALDGGAGNDALWGGGGNNIYRFGRGDGQDTILGDYFATSNIGTIEFKADVAPSDIAAKRVFDGYGEAGLELSIVGTTDKIVVSGFFVSDQVGTYLNPVQQVKFADGTVWDMETMKTLGLAGTPGDDNISGLTGDDVLTGGAGNDELKGHGGADFLDGGTGNDTLRGEAGDDVLDGGAGKDTLYGGSGNNVYRFGRGDGQDTVLGDYFATSNLGTIEFKADVAPGDIVAKRVMDGYGECGLELAIKGTTDKILVSGFFLNDQIGTSLNPVQQVKFADGTVWDVETMKTLGLAGTAGDDSISGLIGDDVLSGGAGNDELRGRGGADILLGDDGNDTLRGEAGDDVLDGGTGKDTLYGGTGNNVYRFGRGDGQDTVLGDYFATSNLGTIEFKADVAPGDIAVKRVSDGYGDTGLELSVIGTTDKVLISGFFYTDRLGTSVNPVQQVKFADGTVWDMEAMKTLAFAGTAGDDTINGLTGDDVLTGGAGNDELRGRGGADRLVGGDGNDTLRGEAGDDVLEGGAGNDSLYGGTGNNVYRFGRGDGQDIVTSDQDSTPNRINTIEFKAGVAPTDIAVRRVNDSMYGETGLELSIVGTTDRILVAGFLRNNDPANASNPVQQVRFADGTIWDSAALSLRVNDRAPTLHVPLTEVAAVEDAAFRFVVPADTFIDADAGDQLSYRATLADGSALPTWLTFDAATLTFAGTPANGDTGALQVKIIASDIAGLNAATTFTLNVANVNDPPTLVAPIGDQTVVENASLGLTLPAGTFADVDADDALTLSATLADGSVLPSWLSFDAATGTFSGTPGIGNLADYAVRVTARDAAGAEASADFNLSVVAAPAVELVGTAAADVLTGLSGSDTLLGGAGDDVLTGGLGDDMLDGGTGDDVYHYRLGDGNDHITDGGGTDRLVLDGVTASEIVLGVGSLKLTLLDGSELHLDDFDPDHPLDGAIETFEFGDGTVLSREQLIGMLGFHIEGTSNDDTLSGTAFGEPLHGYAGNDVLTARGGDDVLDGGAGDDILDGGAGNDVLLGGEGNDIYRFGVGDGQDVVTDTQGIDAVQLKPGLAESDIGLRQVGDDLVVAVTATGETLTVEDWFAAGGSGWTLGLADGTVFDRAAVDARLIRNEAPLLAADGITVGADAGAVEGNVLANDSDPEGRALRVTNPGSHAGVYGNLALAADGRYVYTLDDNAVRTLAAGQHVTERFGYTASDDDPAGALGATAEIVIDIAGTNDAPVVASAVADQNATEDVAFSFAVPNGAFADVDAGDSLSYAATLGNGDPLPSWLSFDAATLTFSGTPANGDVGNLNLMVIATDSAGASVSSTFAVAVANTNDAPLATGAMVDQMATEDMAFSFVVPADVFADVDVGDSLAFSATLADGTALPTWLGFDAATRSFTGTPANSDVGSVSLKITATDAAGVSVSSTFAVAVANTNDAPTAGVIADQVATEDAAFSFTVPAGAFADVDTGDSLSYAATLGNGDPLPSWLNFDAATLSFSGTPANDDVGSLILMVAATDRVGARVTNSFSVAVANTNDAPLAIADSATVAEDSVLPIAGNVLANDSDPDVGSVLAVADPGTWQGVYGSLTLAGDGSYSYALDNAASAVQALGAGQSAVDRFVYRASDSTATTAGELAVTIVGANDIPVLGVPLQDRQLDAKAVFSWQLPTASFVDADSGDTLGYSAALADGSALPTWLAFDAATQTFSGQVPNNAKGSVDIRVTASDGHGSQSVASDVFRVTLGKTGEHGNEGVGNGEDAAPPGHHGNHNDGPGTSPGHPGSKDGKDDDRDDRKSKQGNDANDHKPAYLNPKDLDRHYADFAGERPEADHNSYVERWIEVDLAVSHWMAAQDKSLPSLHDAKGADISALHRTAEGFLGSKTAHGPDPLSLAAGTDLQLKSFRGLGEGLQRLG